MEDARNTQKDEASAPGKGAAIVARGMFPVKQNTVTADVLARFIAGERLTGLESVFDCSTTRLAAVVGYLGKDYAWNIQRDNKAIGCRDGRVTRVSVYWLCPNQTEAALAAGAGAWCQEVKAARRALRAKAAKARIEAARANASKAARRAEVDPRQCGLFGDAGEVQA
jgi:hypothetical protein